MKTVKLTDREIDLVLECIHTNIETVKRRHPVTGSTADLIQELAEMDMDIREQAFRDDGWREQHRSVKQDAETQMFNAGMKAREDTKLSSRAAARRQTLFRKALEGELSETQRVDVWNPDDPRNW